MYTDNIVQNEMKIGSSCLRGTGVGAGQTAAGMSPVYPTEGIPWRWCGRRKSSLHPIPHLHPPTHHPRQPESRAVPRKLLSPEAHPQPNTPTASNSILTGVHQGPFQPRGFPEPFPGEPQTHRGRASWGCVRKACGQGTGL